MTICWHVGKTTYATSKNKKQHKHIYLTIKVNVHIGTILQAAVLLAFNKKFTGGNHRNWQNFNHYEKSYPADKPE